MSETGSREPVTIVIPHYRADVLSECLESLYALSDHPIHVIVVDDGPDAPSIRAASERFPQIEVLRNERNMGFCVSCNRGLEAAATTFAILLNDDTRVTADWLSPLVAAMRDEEIGACQPKLLSATDPDYFDYGGGGGGYIDLLGFTFCRGRLFATRERDQGQYDSPVPLFWACGSALCLRLDAARQVGLLDPEYVAHFEEIDLCWRLQQAGYRIVAVPGSTVFHHSGYSLPPSSFRKSYLNHRNNLVMLFKNLSAARLLAVAPVRLLLEALAVGVNEGDSVPAALPGEEAPLDEAVASGGHGDPLGRLEVDQELGARPRQGGLASHLDGRAGDGAHVSARALERSRLQAQILGELKPEPDVAEGQLDGARVLHLGRRGREPPKPRVPPGWRRACEARQDDGRGEG